MFICTSYCKTKFHWRETDKIHDFVNEIAVRDLGVYKGIFNNKCVFQLNSCDILCVFIFLGSGSSQIVKSKRLKDLLKMYLTLAYFHIQS